MLPVTSFKIVRTSELKPGNLAFLLDADMAPVLVGTKNTLSVAVMLSVDSSKPNSCEIKDLAGTALVVEDWEAEVDYEKVQMLDSLEKKSGALVLNGSKLLIAAIPPSGAGYVAIELKDCEAEGASQLHYGFPSWRIVKRLDHNRTETLIEFPYQTQAPA